MSTDLSLFEAIDSGDVDQAKDIIVKNPDLILQEHPALSHRRTRIRAIHRAVHHGYEDLVKCILKHITDQPKYCDEPIREFFHNYKVPTALSLAKDRGNNKIISLFDDYFSLLINQYPEVITQKFGEEENTLLHLAVYNSHLPLITLLIENGAEIDARNKRGSKPIYHALYDGMGGPGQVLRDPDCFIAGALLGKGAEIDIWIACALGDLSTVRTLLNNNPNLAMSHNGAKRYPYSSNFPLTIFDNITQKEETISTVLRLGYPGYFTIVLAIPLFPIILPHYPSILLLCINSCSSSCSPYHPSCFWKMVCKFSHCYSPLCFFDCCLASIPQGNVIGQGLIDNTSPSILQYEQNLP